MRKRIGLFFYDFVKLFINKTESLFFWVGDRIIYIQGRNFKVEHYEGDWGQRASSKNYKLLFLTNEPSPDVPYI